MSDRDRALFDLLKASFDSSELKHFLRFGPSGRDRNPGFLERALGRR